LNSIQFGASRVFSYPEDRHDKPKSLAQIWEGLREAATQGNPLAAAVVKIDAAKKAKKKAEASNEAVPAWAREALSFLDEYQNDDGNIDDALAALKAAL
jgi:hypothetical protein